MWGCEQFSQLQFDSFPSPPPSSTKSQRGGCGDAGSDLLVPQAGAVVWGMEIRAPWGKQGGAVRQCQAVAAGLLQPLRACLQAVNSWCSFLPFWASWSANGNIRSVLPGDGGGCLQARTKQVGPGTECFVCSYIKQ